MFIIILFLSSFTQNWQRSKYFVTNEPWFNQNYWIFLSVKSGALAQIGKFSTNKNSTAWNRKVSRKRETTNFANSAQRHSSNMKILNLLKFMCLQHINRKYTEKVRIKDYKASIMLLFCRISIARNVNLTFATRYHYSRCSVVMFIL